MYKFCLASRLENGRFLRQLCAWVSSQYVLSNIVERDHLIIFSGGLRTNKYVCFLTYTNSEQRTSICNQVT